MDLRSHSKRRTREERILRTMWSTLKQRRVLSPLVFVFLFMSTPQTTNAMFYFYTNHLGACAAAAQAALVTTLATPCSINFALESPKALWPYSPLMAEQSRHGCTR